MNTIILSLFLSLFGNQQVAFVPTSTPLHFINHPTQVNGFVQFTAVKVSGQNAIKLNWKVNSSTIKNFEIQKSLDGVTFLVAGNVKPTSSSEYTFTDTNIQPGISNFYRVRLENTNGESEYSTLTEVKQ